MPSLKDLKIRIASVKSTRKITKAMQMVAAAKLRRAQEAAEAARPYAERMEAVLANLAAGVRRARRRRGCSPAPASDDIHCWSSPPPSAASAAASTPRSSASPAPTSRRLLAEGKTVKILTVGKKGREQLRRDYGRLFVGHVDLSRGQAARLRRRRRHRPGRPAPLRRRRVRRLHDLLQPLPVGDQPDPDRPAADPRRLRGRGEAGAAGALRVRARRGGDPRRSAAARRRHPDLHRAARERRLRAGRAHERDGQRHPQRRRHDRPADHPVYNRSRQAAITSELIEIISGAEAL